VTSWRLLWRGWRFYVRVHVAVALCVLLVTAVLAGALILGDSADHTLRTRALERLGRVELALDTGPRQVRAALADDLSQALRLAGFHASRPVVPVLTAEGIAKTPDDRALANEVRVLGVRGGYLWGLANSTRPAETTIPLADDEVVLGQPLAEQLGVKAGDIIVLVLVKPSPLPVENPLSDPRDNKASMLLRVRAVHGPADLGHFALRPSATPPLNAFVTLTAMQRALDLPGRANLLLFADDHGAARAQQALRDVWTLDDAQLELRALDDGQVELRSSRVLLEEPVVRAAVAPAYAVTTWFVNELRVEGDGAHNAGETPASREERACPYSMVAAVERPPGGGAYFAPLDSLTADDEIVINDWLADDLGVAVDDAVRLTYYQAQPGRQLVEVSRTFRVAGVTAMTGVAADRELMPDFPGLSDAENCHNWQSDWVDLRRIRPKDEAYWAEHRGTPKAFVTPAAARAMWGSSRGAVTAVRFEEGEPALRNLYEAEATAIERIEHDLLANLDPADLGLTIQPVRERMLASARQATDLGQLFLALGGGVIFAALLLLWLVLSLAVTARSSQSALLRAVGFSPRRARGLLLAEFMLPVLAGVAAGVLAGPAVARALLAALDSSWSGAVGGTSLTLHVTTAGLAMAGGVSLMLAVAAVWLTIRPRGVDKRKTSRDGSACLRCKTLHATERSVAHSVLQRKQAEPSRRVLRLSSFSLCAIVVAAIVVAIVWSSPVMWFLVGAVVLLVGLVAVRGLLRPHQTACGHLRTLRQLAWRNASRRAGPSFALVAMLACAAFLILAVGAYRQQPPSDAARRDSGTGGFALIAQSSVPILGPLVPAASPNSPASAFDGVSVVPMRVRDGEDASCLNLNQSSQPRLLGVEPADLSRRGAFVFSKTLGRPGGWDVLDMPLDDAVPGVADESTIRWSLHKRLGDVIEYTDEQGRPMRVKLVAQLAGSVLQGSVLISRRAFDEHFPSAGGFRFFLVDVPPARAAAVAADLAQWHNKHERGLSIIPASARLTQLQAVENSYLAIFQALGMLALALGAAGLGLVVTRNIQDRRGELATLQAIGFSRRRLMGLVLLEHAMLLALGFGVGVAAAVTTLAPRVAANQAWASGHVMTLLIVVIVVGFASTAGAVLAGFRRDLVNDLRSE